MSEYRQITSWGHIDWLRTKAKDSSAQADIGIVCLLPGKKQAEHTHYSETQFLYMLEGHGEHIIDGVRHAFAPGDHFFLPCGVRHATTNLGSAPMRELMVSIPAHLLPSLGAAAAPVPASMNRGQIRRILLDGIRQLAADTLDHLNVPLVITDTENAVIYDSRRPEICKGCTAQDCPIRCSRQELHLLQNADSGSVVCPKGLTVLMQPVEAAGETWFYLMSGLFHEYPNVPAVEGAYDVPGSTVSSIRILLQDIARYLQALHTSAQQEWALTREDSRSAAIAEAFARQEEKTLNIQIRNHFLFNALNSIASLAIRDNSMDTYTAILDLSELLRGLLRKEGSRVPLSEELIFLQRYISLQELRHEGSLNVVWSRSSAAEKVIVPHNFLQPIAENAFLHGFRDQRGKKELRISTALEENRAVLTVRDNGCGMDAAQLEALRTSLSDSSTHGLSLVCRKLAGVFGMDFTMEIRSEPGSGTTFRITLPC
ncbi:MAG: histidine kinase [Oscillospiraceae bacterium]|nr:histidine kinase [Oscillospiraceae bacterium]